MHWYYSIAADVYDKSNSLIDHVLDGLIYSRLKNNDYVDWVSYEKKTTSLDPMNLILADLLMATATLVCREPVKQRKPERGWQIQRTGLQITVVYNEIACFRIYAIFFFFIFHIQILTAQFQTYHGRKLPFNELQFGFSRYKMVLKF